MSTLSRRRLLAVAGGLAALGAVGYGATSGSAALAGPSFGSNPFKFGVAASPIRNVIWTRLGGMYPLEDSSGRADMPVGDVPVTWKVARNEDRTDVIAQGTAIAEDFWGHSVHVEVPGLPANTTVFYWFEYDSWSSTVGRLRTAPAPTALVPSMTAAVISCANYEHGYFHCYRHIANHQVDLIISTGDFVYADSYDPKVGSKVRSHLPVDECYTLADYRRRHMQYRLDPDEQALRASAGMICTFDDHEIDNDWGGMAPNAADAVGPTTFWQRRDAALRANWENMPLPLDMRPTPGHSLMPSTYRTLAWGTLADFHLLDTRQFRSSTDFYKQKKRDENRYLLGPAQLASLGTRYRGATWDFLVNQVVMADWDFGVEVNCDQWDGFRRERGRVLAQWEAHNVRNPVVLTGDVHAAFANRLPARGREIVSSSITSGGDMRGDWDPFVRSRAFDAIRASGTCVMAGRRRGWVKLHVNLDVVRAQWRGTPIMSSVAPQPDELFIEGLLPNATTSMHFSEPADGFYVG